MGGELPNRVIYLVLMLMRWELTPHYHYFCTKLHSYVHTLYIQIAVIGDECLRKLECRYATEKLLDRLVFWSGPCLLLFALWSDQRGLCCSVRRVRHD